MAGCEHTAACGALTAFPTSNQRQPYRASSVTRRLALSSCAGRKKRHEGRAGQVTWSWYDRKTRRVRDLPCGDTRIYLEVEGRRVNCTRCGKVRQEKLELAANPFYTKRFAFFVAWSGKIAKEIHVTVELFVNRFVSDPLLVDSVCERHSKAYDRSSFSG